MGLFRRLFGPKKPKTTSSSPSPNKEKRRWSFGKRDPFSASFDENSPSLDPNQHAIAVAAATAAVAEAALAAAQAAAEVVRLTSGGSGRCVTPSSVASSSILHRRRAEELAAVKIQSAFRGYLARRALRALKALVKLQALVRGHIVRKQTADMLRRMQTLVRVQARARACRSQSLEPLHPGSRPLHSYYVRSDPNSSFGDAVLDKGNRGSSRSDCWMEDCLWNGQGNIVIRNRHVDDDEIDKILEVDTWEPNLEPQRSNRMFQTTQQQQVLVSDYLNQNNVAFDSHSKLSARATHKTPSYFSGEASSLNSLKLSLVKDESFYRTAENSPHLVSASSRPGSSNGRGPFTPTRSECSWGFFSGYSGYPNYMANTESSRAKVRSQSAPRQRIEFERYGSSKRSFRGFYSSENASERSFSKTDNSSNNAYPATGGLNRIGSTNVR